MHIQDLSPSSRQFQTCRDLPRRNRHLPLNFIAVEFIPSQQSTNQIRRSLQRRVPVNSLQLSGRREDLFCHERIQELSFRCALNASTTPSLSGEKLKSLAEFPFRDHGRTDSSQHSIRLPTRLGSNGDRGQRDRKDGQGNASEETAHAVNTVRNRTRRDFRPASFRGLRRPDHLIRTIFFRLVKSPALI